MAEKKPVYNSPVGEARYPYLDRPDDKFINSDGTGAKFKVELLLDPKDEKVQHFLRTLKEATEANTPGGKVPYHKDINKDTGEDSGLYVVKFSSFYQPRVFGPDGTPIPEGIKVGNGSKIVVAYSDNFYEGFGGGMNLYMQAVMVKELVEFKGADASSFGFEIDPDQQAPWEKEEADDEDNLQF